MDVSTEGIFSIDEKVRKIHTKLNEGIENRRFSP